MQRCLNFLVRFGWLPALLGILVVVGSETRAAEAAARRVGQRIDGFTLSDPGGVNHSLDRFADKQFVVVAFLGVECPLARLYGPRLAELASEYEPRGVAFVGINSNRQDTPLEVAGYARLHGIKFPMLKDLGSHVADKFGAERTPEVYVLDQDRVVRYYGRIDDQYGIADSIAFQRKQPDRRDLAMALDELLGGQPVSVPETAASGCLIGRLREPSPDSPVTYSNQIAAIFQNRCVECHRPNEIGPFALRTYEETQGWGEMIREVVTEERMPPWGASPKHGKFKNEARLSDEEKRLIVDWVDNGCPEGDPSELPEPREFVDGWGIPEPDQVVYMAEKPYTVPAEGTVEYQYFEVDPGFKEDKWVKNVEARPDNRAVVHHIIVFIKEPGAKSLTGPGGFGPTDLLAGYAPGTPPQVGIRGMARMVKAGSKLVFQMHYTPNGTQQEDRSYLGMSFAKPAEVEHNAISGFAANFRLDIPPHDDDYVATSRRRFRKDTLLLSLMPHMHWRGSAFRYELEGPDGTREILLDVPRYDFNWQLVYELAEPKLVKAGSTLHCTAHYDNSENNFANPDPSQRVTWGDQTWEEMMIGWFVSADAEPFDHSKP